MNLTIPSEQRLHWVRYVYTEYKIIDCVSNDNSKLDFMETDICACHRWPAVLLREHYTRARPSKHLYM